MLLNYSARINQIKNDFIHTYKHPYIDESIYKDLLTDEQLHFYVQLFNQIKDYKNKETLFHSLLHIQCSIDVHDQIELHFASNINDMDFEIKQLKILVGDYHSALFYKLLTKNHLLDELYHFITTIKNINQAKMTFIHYEELKELKSNQLFDDLEMIYAGLFDAFNEFFNINDYETKWKPLIYYYLIYNQDQAKWVRYLKQIDDQHKEAFLTIQNDLSKRVNQINV